MTIHYTTDNIDDVNFIGKRHIVNSIIEKCRKLPLLSTHLTHHSLGDNNIKYLQRVTKCLYVSKGYECTDNVVKTKFGDMYYFAVSPCYDCKTDILDDISSCSVKHKKYVYGSETELENFKHYVLNNKLPIFINIAMFINQDEYAKDTIHYTVDCRSQIY